jgi:K+-sensing histidine kinase KdpD
VPETGLPVLLLSADSSYDAGVDDDLVAVLAHGWLNSISIVSTAAETLRHAGDHLSEEQAHEILGMILTQSRFLHEALTDLLPLSR